MTIIEPVRENETPPRRTKKYSAPLRLWHWVNIIIISGSLVTVLINSTITNAHHTAAIMKSQIQQSGVNVTNRQVATAASTLSGQVWTVHKYFGFCLAGLLLFRLILEFFQLADQKFIRSLKSAYKQFGTTNRELARHELAVKIIYSMFYVLLIIMVLTGLSLAFGDTGFFKLHRHSIKNLHGFCMYLVLAFIVVHLAGVFLAERKQSKGIVSDMINGG